MQEWNSSCTSPGLVGEIEGLELSGNWVFEVKMLKLENVRGIDIGNGVCHGFSGKPDTHKASSLWYCSGLEMLKKIHVVVYHDHR